MTAAFPLPSPRVRGVREQYYRAKWLLRLARRTKKRARSFRLLMLAMYPARAVVELMLEAAEMQELAKHRDPDPRKSRKSFEDEIVPKLPYYFLIEKIRIHDFHRFGCVPPDPRCRQVFFGGLMKLRARKGAAVLAIPPSGPVVTTTGESTFKDQRSLCNADGEFFDEETKRYIPLGRILSEFLAALLPVIADFKRLAEG